MRGCVNSLGKSADNREASACEVMRELESGAGSAFGRIAAAYDSQSGKMQQLRVSIYI
jgi:hypothetical protein